jgi:hypothetical protein
MQNKLVVGGAACTFAGVMICSIEELSRYLQTVQTLGCYSSFEGAEARTWLSYSGIAPHPPYHVELSDVERRQLQRYCIFGVIEGFSLIVLYL